MKRYCIPLILILSVMSRLHAQDIPLSKILVEKEGWRVAVAVAGPATHLEGGPGGEIAINQGGAHGTLTTKGNYLPGPPIIIVRTARTALTMKGNYVIDDNGKIACFKDGMRISSLQLAGLKAPACLTLWPDEGHLVIGDGAYLWAVRLEKDGSFGPGDRYYSLRTKPNERMHVAAMTMDAGYLLYACTPIGIQVFDPTGRLCGVIPVPGKTTMTAIAIGGEKADTLFVAAGERIYARKIQGKAAYTLAKGK